MPWNAELLDRPPGLLPAVLPVCQSPPRRLILPLKPGNERLLPAVRYLGLTLRSLRRRSLHRAPSARS